MRAAKHARSLYSALIAVGMTTLIVSQAVLNAFAVLGLAPLTGVPLPFVSYGSTSLVVMLAAMGLLLNVASGATGHVRAVAPQRSSRRTGEGDSARTQKGTIGRVNSHPRRIVIAAGGTAGHVVPALAVADALRAEGAQVAFIGGTRAEAQLVPAAGYELHEIAVEGLSRSHPARAARAIGLAAAALPRARSLLRSLGAEAVLGAAAT